MNNIPVRIISFAMAMLILVFSIGVTLHEHVCTSTSYKGTALLLGNSSVFGEEDACQGSCGKEKGAELAELIHPDFETKPCCKASAENEAEAVLAHHTDCNIEKDTECCNDTYLNIELNELVSPIQKFSVEKVFQLLAVVAVLKNTDLSVAHLARAQAYSPPPKIVSHSPLYLNICVLLI